MQELVVTSDGRYVSMTAINMHNDLFDHGAWTKVTAFLDTREPVLRPAVVRPVYVEQVALAS